MRKVLIIGPAYPYRGGIAAFNEVLARSFQQQGDKVDMLSFRLQYPGFLFPGKTQYTQTAPPDDLHIHSEINSINPLNWILTGLKYRKKEYDLIIFRYWMPFMAPALGTIGRIIKRKKTRGRIIAITDNVVPHEKRPGDRWLTRYFISMCDAFVTLSLSVLDELKLFTDKPVVYHPHPLYDHYGSSIGKAEARKLLQLDPADRYMLFFGLVRKYKGLDILLEAMNDERLKQLNVKLIVAGEFYDDAHYYRNIISEYGLENKVLIRDEFIPDDVVPHYFCAADIVVQPYRTASQSGISQIAYHFNKPMIVTRVGGLPEIVPDGKVGFVTEVNPRAVADAIFRFYEEGLEKSFIENVEKEKKRFQWEGLVQAIRGV